MGVPDLLVSTSEILARAKMRPFRPQPLEKRTPVRDIQAVGQNLVMAIRTAIHRQAIKPLEI
jgi:hypothetical protein